MITSDFIMLHRTEHNLKHLFLDFPFNSFPFNSFGLQLTMGNYETIKSKTLGKGDYCTGYKNNAPPPKAILELWGIHRTSIYFHIRCVSELFYYSYLISQ